MTSWLESSLQRWMLTAWVILGLAEFQIQKPLFSVSVTVQKDAWDIIYSMCVIEAREYEWAYIFCLSYSCTCLCCSPASRACQECHDGFHWLQFCLRWLLTERDIPWHNTNTCVFFVAGFVTVEYAHLCAEYLNTTNWVLASVKLCSRYFS